MKFNTMKRHLREGMKNIFRNGWMTVASVGAVTTTLILVGVFLALMFNLNKMADNIEDDVEMKAFINSDATTEQIQALGEEIKAINGVGTVRFSSKKEELDEIKESFGEDSDYFKLFNQDNPLSHAYVVKATNPLDTIEIANKIKSLDHVYSVDYKKDVVKKLFKFNTYARNIGLVLIVGLIFTAIFLISNTIKLTIMARSKEIGIMKLVGATNGFIRWPFFIEGLLLGVLGSVIPILLILSGYYYIDHSLVDQVNLAFVTILPFNPFAWKLSIIILLVGAFIGVWGSVMSVRKFLKV